MKKVFLLIVVSVVLASSLLAFDGSTSTALAYSYENGNYFGLSVDNTGFASSSNLGYYIGAEGLFDFTDISNYNIGLIAGPSYRYSITEKMSVVASLGISGETTGNTLSLGLGSYAKGEFMLNDSFSLEAGVKMGNNFVIIPFSGEGVGIGSHFYITPLIGIGIHY